MHLHVYAHNDRPINDVTGLAVALCTYSHGTTRDDVTGLAVSQNTYWHGTMRDDVTGLVVSLSTYSHGTMRMTSPAL